MNQLLDTRNLTKQIEFTGRLLDYKEFLKYSYTFVETGNAAGDGLQRAIDAGFKRIYGVEAQKMYYDMCFTRFLIQFPNVIIFHGKSVDQLPVLLNLFSREAVFFLDAHVSGDTSYGYQEWLKDGENGPTSQDNIIKAELAIILANYNKHVIIIDDVNGLADGHAVQYMDIMLQANPDYKFRFYDENLSGDPAFYYKDKLLVAIP